MKNIKEIVTNIAKQYVAKMLPNIEYYWPPTFAGKNIARDPQLENTRDGHVEENGAWDWTGFHRDMYRI